ncbi:MAG: ECF transporter S component [Clostridia bacterium]|nr:ECF transporter S component [Clostridia bacterium]
MSKDKISNKTFRLVGLGILTAIIIVLQIVTTFFPTKPFAITLALIPIIIGAAFYGAGAGAYLGGVFSVVVILMCVFGADVGGAMIWNASPFLCILVCMLKGVGAGFFAGIVYRALSKKSSVLGAVAAGIVSPVVNTGIFLAGLFLFFKPVLEEWAGGTDIVYYALITMTGINFLVELGVNIIVSPVIVRVTKAVKNKI